MRHLRFVPQSQPVLALRAARPGRAERAARVPGAGEKIPVLSHFLRFGAHMAVHARRGVRVPRERRATCVHASPSPLAPRASVSPTFSL